MHKLRTCEIYRDSTSSIFVVESLQSRRYKKENYLRAYGAINPLAVIVCTQYGTTAYDMEAKPADIDELRSMIPELDATIDTWRRTTRRE